MTDWLHFIDARLPDLWLRTGQHILLTGVSTLIAIGIGIPLGIVASRLSWLRGFITGCVGILQTIPSLAMLAILLAMLNRIGTVPAIIALVLYALLPIVRNALAGLSGVPAETMEAADGMGMTRTQRLWLVELPLAAPVIVTGIRTAAVVGVGIATLSAFIGAGGLGQFINRGLALSNYHLIMLGAVASAALALLVDASISAVQWSLRRRSSTRLPGWADRTTRIAAACAPAVILIVGFLAVQHPDWVSSKPMPSDENAGSTIRIGSKNFTEQLILGEIMAQLIKQKTHLHVIRKFGLGGTMICHEALVHGEIDLYPEYTGTALTTILRRKVISNPDKVYQIVAEAYAKKFNLEWLKPFGFNNTYAITVRQREARRLHLKTISDLKPYAAKMRAGWTSEFSGRPDGYPGLQKCYGFKFGSVRDLDTSLMYEAIAHDRVDVICAFSTDGRIAADHLQPLIDNRHFFPPYYAAPVIRKSVLKAHPELQSVLNLLAGKLSNKIMQHLNSEVDQQKRTPAAVAHDFLAQEIFHSAKTH
jgi:osmoprotectant transport system substrate-binding protein/osmoprotectant transport system permease protein